MKMTYDEAVAEARKKANEYPSLYRVRKDAFGNFAANRVPQLRNQFGRDREGELVEPDNWEACLIARGPGGATTSDPETAFRRAKAGQP